MEEGEPLVVTNSEAPEVDNSSEVNTSEVNSPDVNVSITNITPEPVAEPETEKEPEPSVTELLRLALEPIHQSLQTLTEKVNNLEKEPVAESVSEELAVLETPSPESLNPEAAEVAAEITKPKRRTWF